MWTPGFSPGRDRNSAAGGPKSFAETAGQAEISAKGLGTLSIATRSSPSPLAGSYHIARTK